MNVASTSKMHPASLVSPGNHSPALLDMVDNMKISKPVIEYTIDLTIETVDYAMGRPHSTRRSPVHKKFTTFVTNVLTRAEVNMATLIGTLAYIDRARPHLHIALEEWALERVFLGALIVASKYLNDSTLKNVHWAMCTGVFGKRDVGRIEREFLDVLDWELGLNESDLVNHHDGLLRATQPQQPHQYTHYTQGSSTSLSSSSSSSSSSSASSLSDSSMDSPRTPYSSPPPSAVLPKHHNHPPTTMDHLLKSFPIPIPRPPHAQPPLMVSSAV